jgi:hypothetical protein
MHASTLAANSELHEKQQQLLLMHEQQHTDSCSNRYSNSGKRLRLA